MTSTTIYCTLLLLLIVVAIPNAAGYRCQETMNAYFQIMTSGKYDQLASIIRYVSSALLSTSSLFCKMFSILMLISVKVIMLCGRYQAAQGCYPLLVYLHHHQQQFNGRRRSMPASKCSSTTNLGRSIQITMVTYHFMMKRQSFALTDGKEFQMTSFRVAN